MKSILEYLDYRKFMQDFYAEKKRTAAFSWRDFAARAGYSSPVFLKLVCDGKNGLSRKVVRRVGEAMNLAGYELDFFQNLVEFNQAKRDANRKTAYENMRAIAKEHKVGAIDDAHYSYFSSWVYPTIRELAPTMGHADSSEMAKRCVPKVSAAEVENAIRFLKENGMLKEGADGNYEMTEKSIATGPIPVASLAVRNFHRQMSTLALDTLDTIPVSDRNFSTLTLGISKNSYEQILKELEEFRRKVVAITTGDNESDRVYQMNFQLFPLTYSKEEKNET